jgi:hypothetical protein
MRSTMQDGLMWVCPACGARNLNHYENCVSCGRARPPPPDRAPSDVPLPETGRAPACRMIFSAHCGSAGGFSESQDARNRPFAEVAEADGHR